MELRAADWPQWRGPNRDGISSETGWSTQWPADGPKKLWSLNVGTGCSSVSVNKGHVFTMGNQNDTDTVYCLDANTGAVVWKYSYACKLDPNLYEGGPNATPTIDGESLYTLSREGHLFCLNASDSKVIWSKQLKDEFKVAAPTWGFSGSPLVIDDKVVVEVGASGASTVAFNKKNGQVIWKSGNDKATYSSPVAFTFNGKQAVALLNAFGLVVRDLASGAELVRHPWKTSYDVNAATPIVSGDTVFISSGYSKGATLIKLDGGPSNVWQNKAMKNHMNSCVLWKGHLFGFDDVGKSANLACLEFASGTTKWSHEGLGKGSLMIADGKLIVLSDSGELVIADASPSGFKALARAKVLGERCWVVPVLANGHIYCKNNKGDLACVDVSK